MIDLSFLHLPHSYRKFSLWQPVGPTAQYILLMPRAHQLCQLATNCESWKGLATHSVMQPKNILENGQADRWANFTGYPRVYNHYRLTQQKTFLHPREYTQKYVSGNININKSDNSNSYWALPLCQALESVCNLL